ncbi:MAG: PD40 domain-containing protein [Marinilabiliaceae bacterium]|nr:PD40 domain-containing protein [Marinilabiliaceae bacterium]
MVRSLQIKSILLITLISLYSCQTDIRNKAVVTNEQPPIYSDIDSIVIPRNIAPLNIMPSIDILSDCEGVFVEILDPDNMRIIESEGEKSTKINLEEWRSLLKKANRLQITIYINKKQPTQKEPVWERYRPLTVFVSNVEIEPWVAYRKIAPGYEVYGKMGIYQRSLETGSEHIILENSKTHNGCLNCHCFSNHSGATFSLHLRGGSNPGTFIKRNGTDRFANVPKEELGGSFVYPSWHCDGRHIAYSVNKTQQMFHTKSHKRIEVVDHWSKIVVFDTETEKYTTNTILSSDSVFVTFPSFSPDGNWLYYCKAKAVDIASESQNVRYALCRTPFDAQSNTIGSEEEILFDAPSRGLSATFPRVSPDGDFVAFCLCRYGQFSIWHPESDIAILDLNKGTIRVDNNINSSDTESYHSWSHDGKWMIFSTRRANGLFTQPYIAHFDLTTGSFSKPFLMPIERIEDYNDEFYSYNVPEFVSDKITSQDICF